MCSRVTAVHHHLIIIGPGNYEYSTPVVTPLVNRRCAALRRLTGGVAVVAVVAGTLFQSGIIRSKWKYPSFYQQYYVLYVVSIPVTTGRISASHHETPHLFVAERNTYRAACHTAGTHEGCPSMHADIYA